MDSLLDVELIMISVEIKWWEIPFLLAIVLIVDWPRTLAFILGVASLVGIGLGVGYLLWG